MKFLFIIKISFSCFIFNLSGAFSSHFDFKSNLISNASHLNRQPKILFSLVTPSNVQCESKGQGIGVCTTLKSCTSSRGKNIGSCAGGQRTCCQMTVKGSPDPNKIVTITGQIVTLTSSEVNNSKSIFEVPKKSGICQLRVDFQNTKLQNPSTADPVTAGNCVEDFVTVNGSPTFGSEGLTVCGDLSGQHMYLSYGVTSSTPSSKITITVKTAKANAKYSIGILQIPCDSKDIVQENCLQRFTSDKGQIKSFGFPYQLNNQRYYVCTRGSATGVTSTSWSECPTPNSSSRKRQFFIKGVEDATGIPVPPQTGSVLCSSDYIRFPFEATPTRYCGGSFTTLTHLTRDNVMEVHFDNDEIGHSVVITNLPPSLQCSAVQFPAHNCRPSGTNCICTLNAAFPIAVTIPIMDTEVCPTVRGFFCTKSTATSCQCVQLYDEEDEANTGFCLQFTHNY